jgi:hypothetical protein
MRAFNKHLSGIRIGVEHAFGMLKGLFGSLKEMGAHADIQEMYKAIEALLILSHVGLPMKVNTQGRFLVLEVICLQISAQLWTLLGNKCELGQLGQILSKSWAKLSKMY